MANGPDEAANRPRGEARSDELTPGVKPNVDPPTPPEASPAVPADAYRPGVDDSVSAPPIPAESPAESPLIGDRPYGHEAAPISSAEDGAMEHLPETNYHADSPDNSGCGDASAGEPPSTTPVEGDGYHHTSVETAGLTDDPYRTSGADKTPPPGSGSGDGGTGGEAGGGSEPADDGGGPVKSFFEHLEDLRWVLVKSAVAIGVSIMLCLIAGNWLVGVIKWPLRMTNMPKPNVPQTVSFEIGTNFLGTIYLQTNRWGPVDLGTNSDVVFDLVPILVGTNQVFAFQHVPGKGARGRTLEESIQLLNLNPAGGFFVAFQVAIYGGIMLASPFVIYFLADFIFPALRRIERKYVKRGFALGVGLFMMGIAFCYFVLMPLALKASVSYSEWLGFAANQWRAEEYISFVCKFMLGMGLGFELPIVVLTLVKIGLLNYTQLAAFRKYMLVINLLLGAVLTTPEVLTQVMMALPLQVLYEISVWIAWYWERQARKREALESRSGG